MDPSEFEGTVERNEEAVSAGALEQLLNDAGPKFTMIDMTKDIGDLHLTIYTLKESLTKYEEASLSTVAKELDSVAMRLTDLKEGYVNRRKHLTAHVKGFTKEHLDNTDETPLIVACKDIIALFKKEFDGLSSLAKFSENAFINIYKIIRELPDPMLIATEGLNTCLTVSELLKKAQEQLTNANAIINEHQSSSAPPNQSVIKPVELEMLQAKYEDEKEDLKQSYLTEISNLRSKFEKDLRVKELSLTSVFEKQQHELQQQLDATISKKEVEISSMLRTLNDHQIKNQELDERSRLLDAEMAKRRDLEEKWRASVLKTSDLNTNIQELTTSLEKSTKDCKDLHGQLENSTLSAQKNEKHLNRQIDSLNEKCSVLATQLDARPPVNLGALCGRIGSMAGFQEERQDMENASSMSWSQFETYLLESLRKSDAEATQARIKVQEDSKKLAELQAQCVDLQQQVADQSTLATSLEHDLFLAHQAVQANASGRNSKSQLANKMFKTVNPSASDTQLQTLISENCNAAHSTDDLESQERERVDDHSGKSSPGPDAGSYNVNERILLAVQSQRDRYMKASKEKDGELVELKAKHDRLADEQLQLRNENLELYRRLRVLRVSGSAQGGGAGGQQSTGASGVYSMGQSYEQKSRSRRLSGAMEVSNSGDDFNLDEKYMGLYEAEISPFRVEELDRQHMMSRLNVFERGLAYINRHVLQDRWARHALMVYLAFVHFLALIYISKVLNPELIEEVDAHMKAKWSGETLSMPEHPDI